MQRGYLGVDVGTSSTKGVLVADDGSVVASAIREHRVDRPAPGHVEMDAQVWWQEFASITAELTEQHADLQVSAVGLSGMGPCVLLTDAAGTPLRPAILYGVDTRSGEQQSRLEAELGRQQILEQSGSVLSSQAAGPKIAWVHEHEPDVWARARRFFMPASWLVHRLTGEYVLDLHSASQCTPMLDVHERGWHRSWADLVAPGLQLPELRWSGEQAGVTTQPIGRLPAGVPVTTGTIDAWAEAVSVGAHGTGDLMLMYGTTMFLIATVPEPLTSETLWGTVGALPDTHNLAGGMATSGAITAWLRDLVGGPGYGQLVAEAAGSPAGAHGLLMLPYFAGERTPLQDPDARGVLAGLTLSHTRGDLYRAALEATAYGVRHNVETMADAGVRIDRVVAVGGGVQHDLWPQIVSDVTGLDQVIPSITIGASYGAAHLAAALVDGVDIADWNPPQRTLRAGEDAHERYQELYRHYRDLYPATREITHALATIQRASATRTEETS